MLKTMWSQLKGLCSKSEPTHPAGFQETQVECAGPYLAGKRCYLSGPIQHNTTDWRTNFKNVLTGEFKIDLFDPYVDPKQQWVPALRKAQAEKNYGLMREIALSFVRKDLAEVDGAKFLIACFFEGVVTTGTHHEIINAVNAKKPVLLVCPDGKEKIPLWYYGIIRHECMFGSFEDLYTYLREVDAGKHKDNHRWAYIYGLV